MPPHFVVEITGDVMTLLEWLDVFSKLANVALLATFIFVIFQPMEMRRATGAQTYSKAVDILQDEKVRKARREVFRLQERAFETWTSKDIENAEVVCFTYDAVGQMVRHGILPKKMIVHSWGPSLRRSWPILAPLVQKYRIEFESLEYWDDYEWLANEANKSKGAHG